MHLQRTWAPGKPLGKGVKIFEVGGGEGKGIVLKSQTFSAYLHFY